MRLYSSFQGHSTAKGLPSMARVYVWLSVLFHIISSATQKDSVLNSIILNNEIFLAVMNTTLGQSVHRTPICDFCPWGDWTQLRWEASSWEGGARQWGLWRPWRQRHGLSSAYKLYPPSIQFLALPLLPQNISLKVTLSIWQNHIFMLLKKHQGQKLTKEDEEMARDVQETARESWVKSGQDPETEKVW